MPNADEPGASKPLLWQELTWPEIHHMVAGGVKTVIYPIGAIEAHGFHLPVVTDTLCVTEVAHRVSAVTGIPVLPTQPIGMSQGHGRFPGTLSLSQSTLAAVVTDVAASVYAAGIRQILLLNGHQWNEGALLSIREELRAKYDDLQLRAAAYWHFGDTEQYADCPEAPDMLHAEFKETSWLLALRPDLVNMDEAVNEHGFEQFWDYRMDQVSWSNVMGSNTTNANSGDGNAMITATVDALAEALGRALHETIPIQRWTPDEALERLPELRKSPPR
jgi:creatinine amidohydrolase